MKIKMDIHKRKICDKNCMAYFEYNGEPYCDANLMHFSNKNVLCDVPAKYSIVENSNYDS